MTHTTRVRVLAWSAIAAQAVFVGGWLVGGAIEGHGYSPARHDISDLGALTAHHATLARVTLGISGAATACFALFALRPALTTPGRRAPIGAWLVAFSLPALDGFSDAFFRLDCRAADVGCSTSDSAASWHGKVHVVVFLVAAIATVAAPFALAARMQVVDGWRDLVRPARVFGAITIVGLLAIGAAQGSRAQGSAQRVVATFVVTGVVPLARRVLRTYCVPHHARRDLVEHADRHDHTRFTNA